MHDALVGLRALTPAAHRGQLLVCCARKGRRGLRGSSGHSFAFEVQGPPDDTRECNDPRLEDKMVRRYLELYRESGLKQELRARRHFERPRDKAKREKKDLIQQRKWERDNRDWWTPETLESGSGQMLDAPYQGFFTLKDSKDALPGDSDTSDIFGAASVGTAGAIAWPADAWGLEASWQGGYLDGTDPQAEAAWYAHPQEQQQYDTGAYQAAQEAGVQDSNAGGELVGGAAHHSAPGNSGGFWLQPSTPQGLGSWQEPAVAHQQQYQQSQPGPQKGTSDWRATLDGGVGSYSSGYAGGYGGYYYTQSQEQRQQGGWLRAPPSEEPPAPELAPAAGDAAAAAAAAATPESDQAAIVVGEGEWAVEQDEMAADDQQWEGTGPAIGAAYDVGSVVEEAVADVPSAAAVPEPASKPVSATELFSAEAAAAAARAAEEAAAMAAADSDSEMACPGEGAWAGVGAGGEGAAVMEEERVVAAAVEAVGSDKHAEELRGTVDRLQAQLDGLRALKRQMDVQQYGRVEGVRGSGASNGNGSAASNGRGAAKVAGR